MAFLAATAFLVASCRSTAGVNNHSAPSTNKATFHPHGPVTGPSIDLTRPIVIRDFLLPARHLLVYSHPRQLFNVEWSREDATSVLLMLENDDMADTLEKPTDDADEHQSVADRARAEAVRLLSMSLRIAKTQSIDDMALPTANLRLLERDLQAIVDAIVEQENSHRWHQTVNALRRSPRVRLVNSPDITLAKATCSSNPAEIVLSTALLRRLLPTARQVRPFEENGDDESNENDDSNEGLWMVPDLGYGFGAINDPQDHALWLPAFVDNRDDFLRYYCPWSEATKPAETSGAIVVTSEPPHECLSYVNPPAIQTYYKALIPALNTFTNKIWPAVPAQTSSAALAPRSNGEKPSTYELFMGFKDSEAYRALTATNRARYDMLMASVSAAKPPDDEFEKYGDDFMPVIEGVAHALGVSASAASFEQEYLKVLTFVLGHEVCHIALDHCARPSRRTEDVADVLGVVTSLELFGNYRARASLGELNIANERVKAAEVPEAAVKDLLRRSPIGRSGFNILYFAYARAGIESDTDHEPLRQRRERLGALYVNLLLGTPRETKSP